MPPTFVESSAIHHSASREPSLTPPVLCQIEEALTRVGDFGEVRLVVVKGRLRFIQIVRSESVGRVEE